MKSLLRLLERRLERYAVPHVSLMIALANAVVWMMLMVRPGLMFTLALIPAEVMQGQWYRLFSFLALPPGFDIFTLFGILFFYFMGETLENQWGTFRYNIYLLIAYVATVAVAWLNPAMPTMSAYLYGSVFLAFAWLYPEFVINLYFLIPVKVKYVALATWLLYLFTVTFQPWPAKLAVLASVANFLLFFGYDIYLRMLKSKRDMVFQLAEIKRRQQGLHRCTVCGVTEKDDHQIDFRYCSKCDGSFEYCEVHLKNHEHRTAAEK